MPHARACFNDASVIYCGSDLPDGSLVGVGLLETGLAGGEFDSDDPQVGTSSPSKYAIVSEASVPPPCTVVPPATHMAPLQETAPAP